MKNSYPRISEGLVDKIIFLQGHLPALTDWERAILLDRTEALRKYKSLAIATQKQVYQLVQIYKRVKLDLKIDKRLCNE